MAASSSSMNAPCETASAFRARRFRLSRMSLPLLWCALALVGCSLVPAGADKTELRSEQRVWPQPPAPARIRFLRNVAVPADWGIERRGFQRLIDRVTGQVPFHFIRPTGVAARGTALYVADPGAQALVVLDSAEGKASIVTHVGARRLVSPVVVALGPANTLFLVDSALRNVFVLDASGQLLRTIGGEGRLARPAGVAYDAAADRLYVSDSGTHRIVVFAADGRMLGTIGENGSGPGQFNFPTHLALTRAGELLVTDTLNFRVQVFDRDGRPLASLGRVGDGSGNFASPKGVGADSSGHLYVVDALFDAVQVFDREGTLLLVFGERGTRAGQFWLPNGLFVDDKDRVYVADAYNQRVAVFGRVTAPEAAR